eukprot:Gb_13782 [translate_table: standard]
MPTLKSECMHAYNRVSSSNSISSSGSGSGSCSTSPSPSPPSSPRRSPRLRYGRSSGKSKSSRIGSPLPPGTFMQKLACLLLSVLLRRHGVFLFAPLIYISGMLLYMGTMSVEVPGVAKHSRPGLVYRSPLVFKKLWPAMQSDNSTSDGLMAAWQHPREGEEWIPCINRTLNQRGLPNSNGYIVIEANGGLNQQRTSICNAVAVAGLLNATLVIPKFHFNSIWQDPSKFSDIYDEEHFISTLRDDVRVVRELPEVIMERFDYNMSNIYNFRVKAWSPVSYYLEKVLPKLLDTRVIRISPFANRLSSEVPPNIQRLRCLANYEALKFSEPISSLAEILVDRMIRGSSKSSGKYIAVHLRFEEDMVAFSCCTYDGGKAEKLEMDAAREKGWKGKFNRKGRIIKPDIIRRDGKCPLAPLEVGMMLRGMGFDNNTSIYLAAGRIYKAEKNMAPLQQMFPLLRTKETIASPEELAPFKDYSSRMAALDYTVCLHSEVFVTTQGGNFRHFLMGHRRYLYKGHAKTINPDKRKLALLLDNPKIRWETFKRQMQTMRHHSDVKGIELRKVNGSIYTFPTPDCMSREQMGKVRSPYSVNRIWPKK